MDHYSSGLAKVIDLIESNEVADTHSRAAFHQPRQLAQHSGQSEIITTVLGCCSNFHIENDIKTHPRMFPKLITLP